MAKSAAFGGVHLLIAFSVCYALTGGNLLAAGAYAAVEPMANTFAHRYFDAWWERRGYRSAPTKAAVFALMHVAVAFLVGLALTGDVIAASLQLVVEPLANALALVVFDRFWDSDRGREMRTSVGGWARSALPV